MVQDLNKNGVPDYLEKNPSARPKPTPKPTAGPTFNPDMDVPPIALPGFPNRGVQASEAYGWFKLVGAKAPKGTPARRAYDSFVQRLQALGIPSSKWNSVWKDAVDWTQTPGANPGMVTVRGAQFADPSSYLAVLDPADYASAGSTKKYGTTKSKTTQTTKYSPSSASADVNRAIQTEIGRTATKEEIDAYIAGVNAEAKKSPAISASTTTTAPGKGGILSTSTSKVTQTTGFDPTIYAQNFARSRPDFAESFATKSVLGIIQKVLRDPNAIGQVVE